MKKLILVSSGMLVPKKENGSENIYLNYGLLGLGTILKQNGFDVTMYQGDYKAPEEIYRLIKDKEGTILLSLPSFLAVEWAVRFTSLVRDRKIICGGRWVIDNNREWIRKKLPYVDFFSFGCPDDVIQQLVLEENWKKFENISLQYTKTFDKLDYTILYNFKEYQPVIEICRGCGSGCEFCLEKNFLPCKAKSAEQAIEEIKEITALYETDELNFYFEASIFTPNMKWSEDFLYLYQKNNMKFQWRFTTRVDRLMPEILPLLAGAGLKVIDFGLESACTSQLKNMNKTKNPDMYLQKADCILRACYQNNIWAKLNILLYLCETTETINETIRWLTERKSMIKGVSVNPLTVYLDGENTWSWVDEIEIRSSHLVDRNKLIETGWCYVGLSNELNAAEAYKKCKEISEMFMSKQDYEELKEITYTRRKI